VCRTNGLGSVVNLGRRSDDFVNFHGMFSRFGRWFPMKCIEQQDDDDDDDDEN